MSSFPADRRVLVVGGYYVDIIFAGLPRWPRPGQEVFGTHMELQPGGAFTHQRALHRLGVPALGTADLGDDAYSALILQEARAEGMDTTAYRLLARPVRNVSVAVSHAGERGFISFKEPLEPAENAQAIQEAILQQRPACVLITEFPSGPHFGALVAAARQVGSLIVLDCQHVDVTLADPAVADTLRSVDVFAPNAAEARHLTGRGRLDEALDDLAALVPTVVVKNGPEGAIAAVPGRREAAPAPPADVVDTIGAGDCFDAGFVAGHLYGLDLADSLRLATLCGTLAVGDHGGGGAPTLDEVTRHAPSLVPWAHD
jgi:sugar/nucleoside kinase (ribokinase family)